MQQQKKHQLNQLRRWRIRKKVRGSKDRPRMSVCFTNQNIYVQFIDDMAGVTLASVLIWICILQLYLASWPPCYTTNPRTESGQLAPHPNLASGRKPKCCQNRV